jgi:glucose-1-phosphate thymidylyltransferase
MKALILSGGSGTRLRPLTYSQQKQLIPIANKPMLFYAIEDVIEAGAKDIGIIVGPNKDLVAETVMSMKWDANIEFLYQGEPKGLAQTILVAENFLDDDFVMYLGDNILKGGIVEYAKRFRDLDPDSMVMLTQVDEPQRFGVAEFGLNGKIKRLIEKPEVAPSNFALVGIYFFKPVIIDACHKIKPSWRNELEITDAIMWLIENGYRVESSIVSSWWKDTGKPEDILEANRLILDDIIPRNRGTADNSRIIGRAVIDSGTAISNSTIKGPCCIARDCKITDSYIGPYTSIGKGCQIRDTEIEDSIIMDGSNIMNAVRIVDSLVGRNARIMESKDKPKGSRFIIGDNSNIMINTL